MGFRSVLVVLLAFVLSGWVSAQNPRQGIDLSVSEIRKARYEVLTTIISDYYKNSTAPIVIDEFLEPCLTSSYFQGDTDKIIDRLRLAKMNNDCLLIRKEKVDVRLFTSPHRFVVIQAGDYHEFFEGRDCEVGWKDFYKRFPRSQGYVKFSLVGFDETREFAYVGFTYFKECLNGEGHLFIMRKVNKRWEVAADSMLWVA